MPKYANFDSTLSGPAPVLAWYDTDLLHYPNLPASANLLVLTADQWAARMTKQWAVSAGALVLYTPPAAAVDMRPAAKAALTASDMTAIRCMKAGVAFPPAWQAYVTELRAIVSGPVTTAALPIAPAYPAGT